MNTVTAKRHTICVDMDDTLWQTNVLYLQAIEEFSQIMAALGFDPNEAKACQAAIDIQRVKSRNFSISRFKESFLIAYGMLCGKHNKKYKYEVETKIIGATNIVQSLPELFPDTKMFLDTAAQYARLIAVSAAELELQTQRLCHYAINGYFDRIICNATKDEEFYAYLRRTVYNPYHTLWMIGDSLRTDIIPAAKQGFECIHVKRKNWEYWNNVEEKVHYFEASCLTDALMYIISLER